MVRGPDVSILGWFDAGIGFVDLGLVLPKWFETNLQQAYLVVKVVRWMDERPLSVLEREIIAYEPSTLLSSNIKTLRWCATRMLVFLVDLILELAL